MPARILYKNGDKLHKDSRLLFISDISGFEPRKAIFNCICGKVDKYIVKDVKSGNTLSCGCYKSESMSNVMSTHRMSKKPIYSAWSAMVQRCTNSNNTAYKHYGGRGITVCERWLTFENFYIDMGNRPEGMTIDRKDNDKGYSKDNCRWATNKQQSRNKRNNQNLVFNGKTQCLTKWAEETGINRGTLKSRINNLGWSVEKSLTKKVRKLCVKL